jgi:replication-associated recombination protein RarA
MSLATDLFSVANPATPLAERLRPKSIEEVVAQRPQL